MVNGLGPTESTVTLQYFIDQYTEITRHTVQWVGRLKIRRFSCSIAPGHRPQSWGDCYLQSLRGAGVLAPARAHPEQISAGSRAGHKRIYRTGDMVGSDWTAHSNLSVERTTRSRFAASASNWAKLRQCWRRIPTCARWWWSLMRRRRVTNAWWPIWYHVRRQCRQRVSYAPLYGATPRIHGAGRLCDLGGAATDADEQNRPPRLAASA